MSQSKRPSILSQLLDRLIPSPPDFFTLLAEQSSRVTSTVRNLDAFMRTGDQQLGCVLTEDEHAADTLKMRNLHLLNRAFSTPFDREDIYRAIEALDWVVTHSKSTVNEMRDLCVEPDLQMQQIVSELLAGCDALEQGFKTLAESPAEAEHFAHTARHAHRRIERLYRHALANLFQGEVTTDMLRKREIYHHLMDSSRYLHRAANVLHDIMVKLI